jgi:molybdate transport system ATP-binding protein
MLYVDVRKQLREFTFRAKLHLEPGVTVVVGPSGSGKTTLLRLIAGLMRPDAGRIALDERTLYDEGRFVPPHRRDVGYVFQEYALFPHLDVASNVAFGLRARYVSRVEREERVARLLDRLEIGNLADEHVNQLSGGQRQRVALARALIIEPRVLLLDEPLSSLDPDTRGRVRAELREILTAVRVPTLLVTHDEADQAAFPERVLLIESGQVAEREGTAA